MKKILKIALISLLVVYLFCSACWSVVYNTSDRSWEVAEARGGLLVVGFDNEGFYILSPFCCHGDVFLWGMSIDDEGYLYTFSDGLDYFGQFE